MITQETPPECTVCQKPLANRSTRAYHEHCHAPELRPFKCDHCERTFASKSHLAFHEETHLERRLRCPDCDKSYQHQRDLDLHRNDEHLVAKSSEQHKCDKCSKHFPSQRTLARHFKTHVETSERFKCDQCELTFSLKGNLTKHIKVLHSKQKMFSCDLCSKKFYRNNALKFHMLNHAARNFQCKSCDKEFVDARNLERHLKTHVTEKEFRCDICGITSSRRDNIMRHAKSFHPDCDLDKVVLRGDLGERLDAIKKDVQHGNKTKEIVPKPVEPVRVSVIQVVGKPKPLEQPKPPPPIVTQKIAPLPKPVTKVDPFEIYRKILKPSRDDDEDDVTTHPAISSSVTTGEQLNIAPTPAPPTTETPTAAATSNNNHASINNFSEVHWRKRTSQIFTNSTR